MYTIRIKDKPAEHFSNLALVRRVIELTNEQDTFLAANGFVYVESFLGTGTLSYSSLSEQQVDALCVVDSIREQQVWFDQQPGTMPDRTADALFDTWSVGVYMTLGDNELAHVMYNKACDECDEVPFTVDFWDYVSQLIRQK